MAENRIVYDRNNVPKKTGAEKVEATTNVYTADSALVEKGGKTLQNMTGDEGRDPTGADDILSIIEGKETTAGHESFASAPHTVADALKMTEKFLGPDRQWTFDPKFKEQTDEFERLYPQLVEDIAGVRDIIDAIAQQGGVDEVNEFLKKKGYSIRLKGPLGSRDIATASALDIKVQWEKKGEKTTIKLKEKGKEVPAVYLKTATFYECWNHAHPVVELPTKSGDRVFMTRYGGELPKNTFALRAIVARFSEQKFHDYDANYNGIKFPMVDFDDQGNIDWVKGARTTRDDGLSANITQAKYQHRLRMNEVGARAQAAAAMALKGIPNGPLIIDGHFITWFERDGKVFFSAIITEKHMKEPEDLDI